MSPKRMPKCRRLATPRHPKIGIGSHLVPNRAPRALWRSYFYDFGMRFGIVGALGVIVGAFERVGIDIGVNSRTCFIALEWQEII